MKMKVIHFGSFSHFQQSWMSEAAPALPELEALPQDRMAVLQYVVGRRPTFLACVRVEGLTSVLLLSAIVKVS